MGPTENGPTGHSQEPSGFCMYLRHGDSIDVFYSQVVLEIISVSDSANWVMQGR